jgi:hypothetical protein
MARPDTLVHASAPSAYDLFSTHRPPPFSKIEFVSFSNEPITEGKIRHRNPLGAGSSNFLSVAVTFENVIFIALSFPGNFREKTMQPLDIN